MRLSLLSWYIFIILVLLLHVHVHVVQGFTTTGVISDGLVVTRHPHRYYEHKNNYNNNDYYHYDMLILKSSNNNYGSETSDECRNGLNRELTAQERILQEALGIEPESEEDKLERVCIQCEIEEQRMQEEKRTNIVVALFSFLVALVTYGWQYMHPIPAVQLLAQMQEQSAPLTVIGTNGKPTVIDFWAPWCENCKAEAPTMKQIEMVYGNRVNFILVNADQGEAWPLVERFGVDAIPHMAMISNTGSVETALIGEVPGSILKKDIDALLDGKDRDSLPFVMYDAFSNKPEQRQVAFNASNEKNQVVVNEKKQEASVAIKGLPYSVDR